jgi:hypothetical protein
MSSHSNLVANSWYIKILGIPPNNSPKIIKNVEDFLIIVMKVFFFIWFLLGKG